MLLDYAMKDCVTIFNHIGEKDGEGLWSVTVVSGAKTDAERRFKAYRGTLSDCAEDDYTIYLMDAYIDARDLRGRKKRFLPEEVFNDVDDGLKSTFWTLRANGMDCAMLKKCTQVSLNGENRPPEGSETHRITGVFRREWNVSLLTHFKVICA